jgi:hypothetical protein
LKAAVGFDVMIWRLPVEIAGTFTYWRRSSGITTSAKERNMAISSGTLTKLAKRVTGLYLPLG